MGFPLDEVDAEAEQVEHAISDTFVERMDALLGHPTEDPHGDPIPSARGIVKDKDYPSLLDCPTGTSLRIARVTDQATEFLRFLERHGLMPRNRIEVVSRDQDADTVMVRPESGKTFNLGFRSAAKVLVDVLK